MQTSLCTRDCSCAIRWLSFSFHLQASLDSKLLHRALIFWTLSYFSHNSEWSIYSWGFVVNSHLTQQLACSSLYIPLYTFITSLFLINWLSWKKWRSVVMTVGLTQRRVSVSPGCFFSAFKAISVSILQVCLKRARSEIKVHTTDESCRALWLRQTSDRASWVWLLLQRTKDRELGFSLKFMDVIHVVICSLLLPYSVLGRKHFPLV